MLVWPAAEVEQVPLVSGVCALLGPYCGPAGFGV